MLRKAVTLIASLGLLAAALPAAAAVHPLEPKQVRWSFEGPFGQFDQGQLQRGFKVYREVCSSCHSMDLMAYRHLGQPGGPFYDEKYPNPNDNPWAKAIAKETQVPDIDSETGDAITREATAADKFKAPFPNEAAARASNGGVMPPDLSVIVKARGGGPQYVYSVLTGYRNPPPGLTVGPGQHYNPWFPGDLSSYWSGDKRHVPHGGFIAMPPPLAPGRVTFDDGTPSTIEQQAKDVVAFLTWASEPKMEERKRTGLAVMIYLLLLTGIVYLSYRRIWRNVAH
ncbi:MAG TPA: cytochrome c1 [Caulobacteraceae bacterium]|jgi:ubiquinol-cytochrome c reductase cytochrome c1 subunit